MTVFTETPSPPHKEEKPKEEPMETEPEPEVDLSVNQVTKHCVLIILQAYPYPTTVKECKIMVGWVGGLAS